MAEVLPQRQQLRRTDFGILRDRGVRAPKIEVPVAAASKLGGATDKLIGLGVGLFFKMDADNDKAAAALAYQNAVKFERLDALSENSMRSQTTVDLFAGGKSVTDLYALQETRIEGIRKLFSADLDDDQKKLFNVQYNPFAKTKLDSDALYLAGQNSNRRKQALAGVFVDLNTEVAEGAAAMERTGQADPNDPNAKALHPTKVSVMVNDQYNAAISALETKFVGGPVPAGHPHANPMGRAMGMIDLGASAKEMEDALKGVRQRLAKAGMKAWFNSHRDVDEVAVLEQLLENKLQDPQMARLFNLLDEKERIKLVKDMVTVRNQLNEFADDKKKEIRAEREADALKGYSFLAHKPGPLTAKELEDAKRLMASRYLTEAMKNRLDKRLLAGAESRDNEDHLNLVKEAIVRGEINNPEDIGVFIAVYGLDVAAKTVGTFNDQVRSRQSADFRFRVRQGLLKLKINPDLEGPITEVKRNLAADYEKQLGDWWDENRGAGKEALEEKSNEIIAGLQKSERTSALDGMPLAFDAFKNAKARYEEDDSRENLGKMRSAFVRMRELAMAGGVFSAAEALTFEPGKQMGGTLMKRIVDFMTAQAAKKKK